MVVDAAWGARGRRFESCRPDRKKPSVFKEKSKRTGGIFLLRVDASSAVVARHLVFASVLTVTTASRAEKNEHVDLVLADVRVLRQDRTDAVRPNDHRLPRLRPRRC